MLDALEECESASACLLSGNVYITVGVDGGGRSERGGEKETRSGG